MLVTRRSMVSGKEHTMELPVTPEQMSRYLAGAGLIQNIFPNLDASQREFIKTGITQAEWDEIFPPEKEE